MDLTTFSSDESVVYPIAMTSAHRTMIIKMTFGWNKDSKQMMKQNVKQ